MNHKLLSAFITVLLSVEARGMDDIFGFNGSQKDPLEVISKAAETAADALTTVVGVMTSVAGGVYNALPSSARVQEAASTTARGVNAYVVTPVGDLLRAAHDITSASVGKLNRQVDATVTRWEREEEFLDGVAAVPQENHPKTKLGKDGWVDVGISDSESDDDTVDGDASSEDLRASGELPRAQQTDVELKTWTTIAPSPEKKDANPFDDDN